MSKDAAYSFSFIIGWRVAIGLLLYAVLEDMAVGLSLLAVWAIAVAFVIPPFYVTCWKNSCYFPDWFIKGPHQ